MSKPLILELKEAIEKLKGEVLYENETGTTGDITLSESAADFTYLEIFYKRYSTAGEYGTPTKNVKINDPNGKYAALDMNYNGGGILQMSGELIKIQEKSLNRYNSNTLMVGITAPGGSITQAQLDNHYLITKVVGYKE